MTLKHRGGHEIAALLREPEEALALVAVTPACRAS